MAPDVSLTQPVAMSEAPLITEITAIKEAPAAKEAPKAEPVQNLTLDILVKSAAGEQPASFAPVGLEQFDEFMQLYMECFSNPSHRMPELDLKSYMDNHRSRKLNQEDVHKNIYGVHLGSKLVGFNIFDTIDATFRSVEMPIAVMWYIGVAAVMRGASYRLNGTETKGLSRLLIDGGISVASGQAKTFKAPRGSNYEGIAGVVIEVNDPVIMVQNGVKDSDMDPIVRWQLYKRRGFLALSQKELDYIAPSFELGKEPNYYASLMVKPVIRQEWEQQRRIKTIDMRAIVRGMFKQKLGEGYTKTREWVYLNSQIEIKKEFLFFDN